MTKIRITTHKYDIFKGWEFGAICTVCPQYEDVVDEDDGFIDVINSNGILGMIFNHQYETIIEDEKSSIDIALEYFKVIAEYDGHPENMKSIAKEAIKKLT